MFTEGSTIEKTSMKTQLCKNNQNVCQLIPLLQLNLHLNDVIKCMKSVWRDLCYIYLPKDISIQPLKDDLYKKINSSIVLYCRDTHNDAENLQKSLIHELIYSVNTVAQVIIEIKTLLTTHRYTLVYIPKNSFALLTPSSVIKDIKYLDEVLKLFNEDLERLESYSSLKSIKIILSCGSDKLSIKYRCYFDKQITRVTLLNAIYLMLYLSKLLDVGLKSDHRRDL